MQKHNRLLIRAGILLAAILSARPPAAAANLLTVTPSVSGPLAGVFTYSYEVAAGGPDHIFAFIILGPSMGVIPDSGVAPAGWIVSTNPDDVTWISTDAAFDVLAGSSLAGFSFQSTGVPSAVSATLLFLDPETEEFTEALTVETTGPLVVTVVPEPGTGILLAAALLAGCALRALRRVS